MLFDSHASRGLQLANHLVMAPMTRSRATPDHLPTELMATCCADLVAFGCPVLANPDLVARLRHNAALNAPEMATFYGPGAKGYTDCPALAL